MIDWCRYEKRRAEIDNKKEKIKERGAKVALEAFVLQGLTSMNLELEEWAIAFTEYSEENPGEWERNQSTTSDPPKLKAFKDKIENFLDLFGKIRPK